MIRFSITVFLLIWIFSTAIYPAASPGATVSVHYTQYVHPDFIPTENISLCEDGNQNVFILDRGNHKVFKFSKDGRLLHTFGQQGEGPGDFKTPYEICFESPDQIIVTEAFNDVSFFDSFGKFMGKKSFANSLPNIVGIQYAGSGRFLAEERSQDYKSRLILFDKEGKRLSNALAFIDETPARIVNNRMFFFRSSYYSPHLAAAWSNNFFAVAHSQQPEIHIIGKDLSRMDIKIPNPSGRPFSPAEKTYLQEQVRLMKRWPPEAQKQFIGEIPVKTNLFSRVFLTSQYLLIIRHPVDLTLEHSIYPIDIINIDTKKNSEIRVSGLPVFVSEKGLYLLENEGNEDSRVTKRELKISI